MLSPTTSATSPRRDTRPRGSTFTISCTRAPDPRRAAQPSPPAPARPPRSSVAARSRERSSRPDRPLDVAIVGEGYIEVRRPDGTIGLTRNGVAAGRRPGTTHVRHRHAASTADPDPERHLDRLGQDRPGRHRPRRHARPRPDQRRHRARPGSSCSPTATARSARPRRAVAFAGPPARRSSRARSRDRTSTSRPDDGRDDRHPARLFDGEQGDHDAGSDAPDRQPGEAMSLGSVGPDRSGAAPRERAQRHSRCRRTPTRPGLALSRCSSTS